MGAGKPSSSASLHVRLVQVHKSQSRLATYALLAPVFAPNSHPLAWSYSGSERAREIRCICRRVKRVATLSPLHSPGWGSLLVG